MWVKRAAPAIVLCCLAASAAAQERNHLEAPAEAVIAPKAASPQCSLGVVYDDSVFGNFYSLGDGDPGDSTMVMRLDLPAGTTGLDQVCLCFTRGNFSTPSSMSFNVVIYNDNGPGGVPGTLIATVPATAASIPLFPGSQFFSVNLAGAVALPDTSVYVGASWPGGELLMCGDRSGTTTQRLNYGSFNGGLSWDHLASLFTTNPPRAMGIRADPSAGPPPACTPTATALCLNGGRFRVEATYETTAGATGPAQVVKLTDETGYLWFFSAANVEAVVKVLNACSLNNRFWVFAGGLTNVRTVITVTDTTTGAVKTYLNPQSTAFQPIQDTSAFATCP